MPPDLFCLPLLLSVRMRCWWWLYLARRSPLRAVALLGAVVLVAAGLGMLAVHGPTGGCSFRVVPGPGRPHWICERGAGHGA